MGCLVVKLGSSIVVDDRGEPRVDVLGGICDQLEALHRAGREPVVVTSGAIARGMGVRGIPLRPRSIDELQAASAVGQGKLYQVYDELLRARGVPTAQVLLTFFDMSARTHYLNARQTLRKLLDWQVLPVINENDTTATDEISFGNNDFLAAQVAILLGAELLVLLTDAAGVYTADPRSHPGAQLVPEVAEFEALEGLDIGHAPSPLGSGGMRSKVVAAEMATAAGIPAVIASGLAPGTILAAAGGRRSERGSMPARGVTRASSCGFATPSRRAGGSWSTRAPPTPCGRGGPACSLSAWSTWRATSTPATPSRSPTTVRMSARGSATTRRTSFGRYGGSSHRRCASCCRVPARRPSIATTSC